MKKILITLILSMMCLPALAYEYELHDENGSIINAVMYTFSVNNDKEFLIGFYGAPVYCGILEAKTNNVGKVTGKCFDEINQKKYSFKEIEKNTFYNEVRAIVKERSREGRLLNHYQYYLLK